MKSIKQKINVLFLMGLFLLGNVYAKDRHYVYKDADTKVSFVSSGWMGNNFRLLTRCFIKPKKGKTCLKLIIYHQPTNQGWSGIYWQYPYNNWGQKTGSIDLSAYSKLVFWARGHKGGEIIANVIVGGIEGEKSSDSTKVCYGLIQLSKKWKKYIIDLKDRDLSSMIGGFCLIFIDEDYSENMIIYFDDIYYE